MQQLSKKTIAVVASVAMAQVALAGCGNSQDSSASVSKGANCDMEASGPVDVGVVLPLTGDSALLGEDAKKGIDLAMAEVNADGGFFGERQVEVHYEDDKGTPQGGVTGVQKFMSEGVQSIMAGLNSSVAIAEASVTKNKILHIQPAAQSDEITENGGNYLFQVNNTISQNSTAFNSYIVDTIKPESVAYLGNNSAFNDGVLEALKKDLDAAGIELVSSERYEASTSDFSSTLNKAQAEGAETLFIADAYPARLATLMRQARQIGGFENIIVAPGTVTPATVQEAGQYLEGIITGQVYHSSIETPGNEAFSSSFKDEYNEVPGATSEIAYEAAKVLAQAVNSAGTLCDYDAIAKTLNSETFETPRGELRFGDKGRPIAENFYILTVDDNQIEVVDVLN